MKKIYLIYLIQLILINSVAFAQAEEEKLFLSGYLKNIQEFNFIDNFNHAQWTTLLHNRLNFKYILSEEIQIRLEVRNRIFYGDRVKAILNFSDLTSEDTGFINLSWNIIDHHAILFNIKIDRASLNYIKNKWDITVGKQRVNWGVNLVWNPNDIFNTYNFLEFDYDERPGSDAIRIQYYLGDFKKVEFTAKKGNSKDDYIFAGMYKFNKWLYDVQLITGIYQKDWVIGGGWAGNIQNSGFKGEISYFIPYESYMNAENTLSSSISFDYAFKKGLYLNGSILYSSQKSNENNIEYFLTDSLSPKQLMPFKYTGLLQLSKEFSPIIRSSLSVLYSNTNQTVIAIPSVNYSIAKDFELNLTGQSFFEFEKYQNLASNLYLRLRWSF